MKATRLICKGKNILVMLAALLIVCGPVVLAQEEPSPIEIELVAPGQASPGQTMRVQVQYTVTDPNAGAVLNYNLYGPGVIVKRNPEPPNLIVNTWGPKFDVLQGTIEFQIRVEEGTDGQALKHEIEVKWGPKFRKITSETQIKFVPPTATPRPTPRPTAVPTQPPPTPVRPTINLAGAKLVQVDAIEQQLSTADVDQELAIQIEYQSTGEIENASVRIWFEPDTVNLNQVERVNGAYELTVSSLPAAPDGGTLVTSLTGRIRPFPDGGENYELRGYVALQVADTEAVVVTEPTQVETNPVKISQQSLLVVRSNVEQEIVKSGGSIIVHAHCANLGQVTIKDIKVQIAGLPQGFVISPEQQTIAELLPEGGTEEKVFAIRVPEDLESQVSFIVTAKFDEKTTESEPQIVEITEPIPLAVSADLDQETVYAGGSAYINATFENQGVFTAQAVQARLVDTTGNLGVQLQSLGDIEPSEIREIVFVVEIPSDFPADVVASLQVQAISEDGSTSASQQLPLTIVCVPQFEISAQPPAGKVEGGQSVEMITLVRNTGQCVARKITVEVEGLPTELPQPPEQTIAELLPGEERLITFNLLLPEGYPQGQISFSVLATDSLDTISRSPQTSFAVGGVSMWFTIVFGLLSLLAVAAIIVGLVLYFRQ